MKHQINFVTKLFVVTVVLLLTMGTTAMGQLLKLDEPFDYGTTPNADILLVSTGWLRHSGAAGPAYDPSSLIYSGYAGSDVGGRVAHTNGGSGVNDGDVNKPFTSVTGNGVVYVSALVNLASAKATADYFFHLSTNPLSTSYMLGRVTARTNGAGWSLGLSKTSASPVLDNTVLNFNTTYLVVLKYTLNTTTTSDDEVTLYVYDSGVPATEPGSPIVTVGPTGNGVSGDPTGIGSIAIRQGTNTPTGFIDGIRVGTQWDSVVTYDASKVISANSEIIGAGNEADTIHYTAYQASAINATTDGLRVWSFTITDGASPMHDDDPLPTILNSVIIDKGMGNFPEWGSTIRQAALFDGSTKIAEVSVTGETITFAGLNYNVGDNSLATLDLYLTFEATATDQWRYVFQITNSNVTVGAGSSNFSAFPAQISGTTGWQNKVDVVASKLTFSVDPPATVAQNNPFTVHTKAMDVNNIEDYDFTGDVTLSVAVGTGNLSATSGLTKAAVIGNTEWTDVVYDKVETGVQIQAASGTLTPGTSAAFDVVALSAASDIIDGPDVIVTPMESTVDTYGEQVEVFNMTIRDGGGTPDGDGVATKITGITFVPSGPNTIADWSDAIAGAELFNGVTSLGTATINAASLVFSGSPLVTVPDDGSVNVQLFIYLKNSITAQIDNQAFNFMVNQNSGITVDPTGSLFSGAGNEVNSTVAVDVEATALHFVGTIGNQKSGVGFNTQVKGTDLNGNLDVDFLSTVTLTVNSGTGTISGATSSPAVSGFATFTGTIITGGGSHTLQAAYDVMSTLSNSFVVDQPATFKVASAGLAKALTVPDTLVWNNTTTWTVTAGYDLDGIPDANDDVILDNEFRTGSYVVRFGPSVRDTAKSITIGYVGNTNTIEALIPQNNTVTSAFVVGDAVAGNIDLMVMEGGRFVNASGISGTILSVRGYSPATDTVWVRSGGKILWATKASSSGLYRSAQRVDGDYGIVEFDVPDSNAIYYYSSSGAYYPNLVFSANNAGGKKTYCTSSSAGYGPCLIKGNLTINIGAKDSLGSYADNYRILGDVVNYGTFLANAPTTVQFMGSDQQELIGNAFTFNNGFTLDNVYGVALQADVVLGGGTATLTNGNVLTVGRSVTMDPNGSIAETNGFFVGTISATRTLSTGVNDAFGNIGFEMNAAGNAPGVTTVARTQGSWLTGNGNQSIKRYFDVTAAGSAPYNATVVFRYATSELNGNNEADLFLHWSNDAGATWKGKAGTVSTSLHKVTTTTINNTGRFTLASLSTPLYITHTVTMKKFQDDDGDLGTPGTAKKWYMELYENSLAPENLVNYGNLSVVATNALPAGTYLCLEADSAGWNHAGHKIDNGFSSDTHTDGLAYDTIIVSGGVDGTFEFYNSKSSSITVNKFRDLDGDPLTTGDQTAKEWGLALYKDAVGGSPVAEGNTSSLVVNDLATGTYIAVEADSAGWYRCDGSTPYDTLVLTGGASEMMNFINVKANTLTVRKFQDDDGIASTTADQTAKAWYLEIHKGAVDGDVVASGNATEISSALLPDGSYYFVEADSTPWVSLGHAINSVYQEGTDGQLFGSIALADGQVAVVDLFNAPAIYGGKYRTFNPDSIALETDNLGKLGKAVKNKATGVDFVATIVVPGPGYDGLHLEFGTLIDTLFPYYTDPTGTWAEVAKSKRAKWNITFPTTLDSGITVTIYGHGAKGNFQKVGHYWMMGGVKVGRLVKTALFTKNIKTLPMPNRLNALTETMVNGYPTGMTIGVAQPRDSAKKYGWVFLKKAGDVQKSLYYKNRYGINLHDQAARGFDTVGLATTRPKNFVGKYTSLPPTKQDNILFANLAAFKVSIAASALDITPVGLADLILNDTDATNPWNGLTLLQLAAEADTMMTGYPNRTFETADTYAKLSTTIRNILDAFEGLIDSSRFGLGTQLLGTNRLIDCKILKANPNATPYRIVPSAVMAQTPDQYALYQNYPNPFNPATTIQFDLPMASTVTLKIFNILGQEVATLLNNEQLDEGQQLVNFDAASFATGVYFYRITAQSVDEDGMVGNTFTSVKKMMLVK